MRLHRDSCSGDADAHVVYDRLLNGYRPIMRCACGVKHGDPGPAWHHHRDAHRAARGFAPVEPPFAAPGPLPPPATGRPRLESRPGPGRPPSGRVHLEPTQRRLLAALTRAPIEWRRFAGNERQSAASLIRHGWADNIDGLVSITDTGRAAIASYSNEATKQEAAARPLIYQESRA